MKQMRVLFGFTVVALLAACASSSSTGVDLTVTRGDATARYAGTYNGTISLTSTADVVGTGVATDNRVESVAIRVTADGLVVLTVRGANISGVVDNNGNWGVQASIDDLSALISNENISLLRDAGCPLGAKAARIQGKINPPSMTGQVSGNLKCKRAEVTIATLNTTGRVAASSTASSGSTTATGDLQGASNAAPTTPGTQRFKLELKQTVLPCGGCGWLIDSTELVIKHEQGTFRKKGPSKFVIKLGQKAPIVNIDFSSIPTSSAIKSADFYMVFNVHEGIANADYKSVVEAYGWINNKRELVRTLYASKDIKDRGYSKANPRVPFDFTAYAKKLHR